MLYATSIGAHKQNSAQSYIDDLQKQQSILNDQLMQERNKKSIVRSSTGTFSPPGPNSRLSRTSSGPDPQKISYYMQQIETLENRITDLKTSQKAYSGSIDNSFLAQRNAIVVAHQREVRQNINTLANIILTSIEADIKASLFRIEDIDLKLKYYEKILSYYNNNKISQEVKIKIVNSDTEIDKAEILNSHLNIRNINSVR